MNKDITNDESDKTEINSDQLGILLVFILFIFMGSKQKLWDDFKTELLTGNRFFPDSPIPEIIKKLSSKCIIKIEKDTILYRARLFNHEENSTPNYLEELMQSPDIMENEFCDLIELMNEDEFKNLNLYETLGVLTFIEGFIASDPLKLE